MEKLFREHPYSAVAAKIMAEDGIAIDDLHAKVIRQGRPKSNNVHDTGNRRMAGQRFSLRIEPDLIARCWHGFSVHR